MNHTIRLIFSSIILFARTVAIGESADDCFKLGNADYGQGDLDGAISNYTKVIALIPNAYGAYNNRGIARQSKGDLNGAIKDFSKVLELKPDYAEAYNNRGYAKSAKNDLEGAVIDYDQAIKLNPSFQQACNNRGTAKYMKSDFTGAFNDYEREFELITGSVDPNRGRKLAELKSGGFDSEMALTGKLGGLKPGLAEALLFHGHIFAESDPDIALADYTKALDLLTNFAEAYYNRGIIFYLKSKNEYSTGDASAKSDAARSIEDFAKFIQIQPTNYNGFANRGVARILIRDWEGAISDFERAKELKPNDVSIAQINSNLSVTYRNRSMLRNSNSDLKGAISDANEAIALDPSYAEAYEIRGSCEFDENNFPAAIKDCTKAIELKPDYVNAYVTRSFAEQSSGDSTAAKADSDKVDQLRGK